MRVLVTGGAGFIGSHLVRGCLEAQHEVRVLDDFSTGRRENLRGVGGEIELVEGSITELETVRKSAEGCEVIFHLAALPSVPLTIEEPLRTHRVNMTGTLNVLVAAQTTGVRRVVYSSSCAVYGEAQTLPVGEDASVRPASPYAVQKYGGELYVDRYVDLFGLEAVSLRYFNVYGPGQDPSSTYAAVVPRFISALAKGEEPVVFGDGLQSRDFVFVGDVVEANLAAASVTLESAARVFNVASGSRVTVLELLAAVACALGREDVCPRHESARPGDLRDSVADTRRARAELDWCPRTTLAKGLAATVTALTGKPEA